MNTNNMNQGRHLKNLLIVGLGDVARRALPQLKCDYHIYATQRVPAACDDVFGVTFDLDESNFANLPKHVDAILYTAPPPSLGGIDTRIQSFLKHYVSVAPHLKHIVYISTTGVYGDCAGAWVDETRTLNPISERGVRRADAENRLTLFALQKGLSLSILRAPGIYALERLPLDRIRRGVPILNHDEDVFSNHIHADDLAAMCVAAIKNPCGINVFNATDDLPMAIGEWFTRLALAAGLPVPKQRSEAELKKSLTPIQWSFMQESRRLSNSKIKSQLKVELIYPTIIDFIEQNQERIASLGE